MNTAELRRYIQRKNWYKQGAAVKLMYIGYPLYTCFNFAAFGKKLPVNFRGFLYFLKNEHQEIFFPTDVMERVARYYYKPNRNNLAYIRKLKSEWNKRFVHPFLKDARRLFDLDLSVLDDKALRNEFEGFSRKYERVWQESIFLDAFDLVGEKILQESKRGQPLGDLARSIDLLLTPDYYSWLQQEQSELLPLVTYVRSRPALQKIIKHGSEKHINQLDPFFYRKVLAHVREFHWLYNDFIIIRRLPASFFLERISHMCSHRQNYQNVLKQLHSVQQNKKKKNLIIKNKIPPLEVVQCCLTLAELSHWRDSRKAHNQRASSVIRAFLIEFSKRTNIAISDIENFYWRDILKSNILTKKRAIELRNQIHSGILVYDDPQKHIFSLVGSPAQQLRKILNSKMAKKPLTGRSAYPGIVVGQVKIIKNQNEFSKMKRGDILVAPNTRPEYVPIMKLAGAIISEEGGITCHSAIVSRELQKPCIVGVQSATLVLKDGDRVEVDAISGVVRKL